METFNKIKPNPQHLLRNKARKKKLNTGVFTAAKQPCNGSPEQSRSGGKGVSLAEETKRREFVQREREREKNLFIVFSTVFFFWATETDKVHDSRAQGFTVSLATLVKNGTFIKMIIT